MEVQQEVFTAIRQILVDQFGEGNVFDGSLPPEGTSYPFAYLADATENETAIKGSYRGDVTQTVHIFHDRVRERGTLSRWLQTIKREARRLEDVEGHSLMFDSAYSRIIPDRSTSVPLMHGVLEITYRYIGGN